MNDKYKEQRDVKMQVMRYLENTFERQSSSELGDNSCLFILESDYFQMRQNEADIQARLDQYEQMVADLNDRISTLKVDNPQLAEKFTTLAHNLATCGSVNRLVEFD